jgi:hypothetical protein
VNHTAGEEDWIECVQHSWQPIKTSLFAKIS